jgi:hypothetical protein
MIQSTKPSANTHVFAQFLASAEVRPDDGSGSAAVDEEPLELQVGRDGILPYFYVKKLLLEGKAWVR